MKIEPQGMFVKQDKKKYDKVFLNVFEYFVYYLNPCLYISVSAMYFLIFDFSQKIRFQ